MDVRAQHRVGADPDRTWQAVLELPRWWPRRWSEDRRLVFEPRVGGRLGPAAVAAGKSERVAAAADFADGAEGELWGVVTVLRPRQLLVVDGSMGMTGPVLGRWRLLVEPADVKAAATTVTVEHRVLGAVVEDDRQCYATGWEETLTSLAAFAEDPGWWGV
jgi:hypothetical protein